MSRVAIELTKDTALDLEGGGPQQESHDELATSKDEQIEAVKSFDKFGVDVRKRSSNLLGFTVNNANAIVGAGILALPWTISQTGWVLGIILLLVGAVVTNLGLFQMALVADFLKGDQLSFGTVGERAHRYFPLAASFMVWFYTLLMAIVYLGTAADYLVTASQFFAPAGASAEWYLQRMNWVLICFFLIGLPLSLPRKTTALQYTSFLAVIFIVYTTVLCAVAAFFPQDELCNSFLRSQNMTTCLDEMCCSTSDASLCCIGEVVAVGDNALDIISSFPTMTTAFACSTTFFTLYNDLKNPTVTRLKTGTTTSLVLVSILYFVLALFSYFTYGNEIQSNVLQSYPVNTEFTVARLGMAALLCFSYPLMLHPCRDSFLDLMDRVMGLCGKTAEDLSATAASLRYYSTALLCNLIAFLIASLNLDISVLLNVAGSLAVTWISFILPGMYFLFILGREDGEASRKDTFVSYFLIIFGLVVMLINIVLWFV